MFAWAAISVAARPLARARVSARHIKRFASAQQVEKFHLSPALRQQHQERKCPNCNQPLPSSLPACTSCWYLFSLLKDTTPHELLGIEGENPFVIDIPTLKHQFRKAQTICHPDTWASKNPDQIEVAQSLSSRVNHAYRTLLDPLARIEYLIEKHNVPLAETDKGEDIGFMMEIMEAREAIDDAENSSEVESILRQTIAQTHETIKELEALVQNEEWVAAKAGAIRLRYLRGIEKAANQWLHDHSRSSDAEALPST